MAAVRGRDTKAELSLRRALFALGFRYRVNDAAVFGKPDIAFRTERIAVFVDGDFWHGNAWRVRGLKSFDEQFRRMQRSVFWRKKISRNVERDTEVNAHLKGAGWLVLRFWESELEKSNRSAIRRITTALNRRRRRLHHGA